MRIIVYLLINYLFIYFPGPEFEARIRQNEINNKKFNFLNPGDPYNAYYQHKVKEFKEGKGGIEFYFFLSMYSFFIIIIKEILTSYIFF